MTKSDLLRNIAQTAYNVGYGAKKHFATYDLASKAPGIVSFLVFSVGVVFLIVDFAAKKYFSVACIVLGMIGMRVSMWDHKKDRYDEAGRALTDLFNQLKDLYFQVKSHNEGDLSSYETALKSLQEKYNQTGLSSQMMFSDWYAHYKFFWQQQIDWVDEELKFRLLRDKIPLSFSIAVGAVSSGAIVLLVVLYFACKT